MTTTTLGPDTLDSDRQHATKQESATIAVWDLPTRIFHWSLAASFAASFLTAESERWRDVHVMLGYTVLALIGFRLVWGFVGTRHARFSSFATGPARVAAYARSLLSRQPEHHVGHNPAGAVAIFLLLALGLVVGASGYATFNDIGGDPLEELHELAANAMLAVVAIHVLGVIVSSVLHRENLVGSMITGNKTGPADQGIATRHRVLGIALLVAVLSFWGAWTWSGPTAGPGVGARENAGAPGADAGASKSAGERRRHRDDD